MSAITVLPLLIERRIAREQNIAAALDDKPQFFVNNAVKRVVHRHVRCADAERLVRLRHGLMGHGGKSRRQQQRRRAEYGLGSQGYPAFRCELSVFVLPRLPLYDTLYQF
ncbi:hypothetical protein [uncultured Agathobaculum sp.]|uniref:hypothetical protein n=1 Tax=uncultured Agathobaculum sp. TaxID=2048140 RepID=UPI00296FEC6F